MTGGGGDVLGKEKNEDVNRRENKEKRIKD